MEDKILIAQIAPSARVSIGEEFGMQPGTVTTKKIVAALRQLGFDKVFDTQFGADLTIMEEASELMERIEKKGKLPMFNSCCPAWVYFMEKNFPQCTDHLSSCKSPQQMMGAIVKTYYAEKNNLDPKKIYFVSIMPCMVKKFEAKRKEMKSAYLFWKEKGLADEKIYPDVDAVISTHELANLLKKEGIDLPNLPEKDFDHPLGTSTGAATIFGATGGIAEATLRTAYELITKKPLEKIEFEELRGIKGLKKANISINGFEVKIAVVNGIFQAKLILDEVIKDTSQYHFIEVMNCQGGCIGGSGQPRPTTPEIRVKRLQALYENDKNQKIRKSHENPDIIELYKNFLKKPLSHEAHLLLHTSYQKKSYE